MKKLFSIFFLCVSLPTFAQTINVTAIGAIGVSCSDYGNYMNRVWEINIPGNRQLVLDYHVRVEHSFDKVLVYSINDSGMPVLQATLTGSQTGSLQSLYSNGKMRVVFTSDGSVNCTTNPTYSGFTINLSKITGISYSYDVSGNRTNRTIVLESGGGLRSSDMEYEGEEIVFTEKIAYVEEEIKQEAEIRIYPNPTEGRFYLEIDNLPSELSGEAFLYDVNGRYIDRKTIETGERIEFDLSREASGAYILKIHLDGQISTWKIIKK
jgi:hypothetical protein